MKETISGQLHNPSGMLDSDMEYLLASLRAKKTLYGDMLRQDSLAWRVLGFPIKDLRSTIAVFKDVIYNLVWSYTTAVNDAIMALSYSESDSTSWEKVPVYLIIATFCCIDMHYEYLGSPTIGWTFSIIYSDKNCWG